MLIKSILTISGIFMVIWQEFILQYPAKKMIEFHFWMALSIFLNLLFAADFGLYVAAFGYNWIRLYKRILQCEILLIVLLFSSILCLIIGQTS